MKNQYKIFIFNLTLVIFITLAFLTFTSNIIYTLLLPEVHVVTAFEENSKNLIPVTCARKSARGEDFIFVIKEEHGYFGEINIVTYVPIKIETVNDNNYICAHGDFTTEQIVSECDMPLIENQTVRISKYETNELFLSNINYHIFILIICLLLLPLIIVATIFSIIFFNKAYLNIAFSSKKTIQYTVIGISVLFASIFIFYYSFNKIYIPRYYLPLDNIFDMEFYKSLA